MPKTERITNIEQARKGVNKSPMEKKEQYKDQSNLNIYTRNSCKV